MVAHAADALPGAATEEFFRDFRAREFAALNARGLAYLDYTGAAIPAKSQLKAHDELLRAQLFGNPHSENEPSRASTAAIDVARHAVCRFLDADPHEYSVCFTANTSASVKLVAESFPFGPGIECALTADNHNSVNGVREFARRAGARVVTLPLTADLRLDDPVGRLTAPAGVARHLLCFPAQSNFSGVRHSLSLVGEAQDRGYDVLLDVAAYVPTASISLRQVRPEFVVLSFYKVFGFPTGVGALVARRDALARLQRPWFAGGTVDWVSVEHGAHQLRQSAEGFEDGTPNYLGIASLGAGFDIVNELGITRIGDHVRARTAELIAGLREAVHCNGEPMFTLYGPRDLHDRGGSVAFNVRTSDARTVPYEWVETRARERGVALRGGCFCNPGAAEAAFGFAAHDSLRCLRAASGAGFTPRRFADCLGGSVAVGAVRASAGVATSAGDIRSALDVLTTFARDYRML